jgi:hypothetical protein
MRHRTGLALGISLAVSARAKHKAHMTSSRAAPDADVRNHRASGPASAYDAMPARSPSFGYGVGDNSHGCSACN